MMNNQPPKTSLNLSEVAKLARQYWYPYNTYGRMKGSLNATGQLPPDKFRRTKE